MADSLTKNTQGNNSITNEHWELFTKEFFNDQELNPNIDYDAQLAQLAENLNTPDKQSTQRKLSRKFLSVFRKIYINE